MPSESLSLSKSSLAYAKLTATPTDTGWSQVYNAGNLFACLSLSVITPGEDRPTLQNLGKELFNNLEAEFFTLEEKNPETIAEAIKTSTKHIPDDIAISFSLAYFKTDVLYLFLQGKGRIIMKRAEKLGVLLEQKDESDNTVSKASGYLQNSDTVILQTNRFATNIQDDQLTEALGLSLPNDIAESLSIQMHKVTDGDQAAIIIVYHGMSSPISSVVKEEPQDEKLEDEELDEEEKEQTARVFSPHPIPTETEAPERFTAHHKASSPSFLTDWLQAIRLPFNSSNKHIVRLSHRKKIFLSVTVVILVLLVVSVVFTKQKQETTQNSALFESIYTPALKNYDEGKALATLNEDLSHEDFVKAQDLLKNGENKFPKDSKENKQITELLAKVEAELGGVSSETPSTTSVKETTVTDNSLLAVEKKHPDGKGFSQNATAVYFATTKAATSVTKSTGKESELVTNDGDWHDAVAIVPYQANFYILDKKDGVLKYVAGGNEFSKNSYLKSEQDLSKAVSMAIDSSLWILFSDGTIKKFTKGEADTFTIKGLTKPLKSPSKIYTDADITNVYILDNGNGRIVKLANDGTFQAEYTAGVIKTAKDFEVLEQDKKIIILSGEKTYEIAL